MLQDHFIMIAALIMAAVIPIATALAPFEPPDGSVARDSPLAIQNRIRNATLNTTTNINAHTPTFPSLYHINFHIDASPRPHSDLNTTILNLINEGFDNANTDAILLVSVDPVVPLANVSEVAVQNLASSLKMVTDQGKRVVLRYASGMNDPKGVYGTRPSQYIHHFRKVVNIVRDTVRTSRIAIVWSPIACGSYIFGINPKANATDIQMLDTNADGKVDMFDNPFDVYYPGDSFVDYVGLSVYDLVLPINQINESRSGEVEDLIVGKDSCLF
ncbi:hypothetical protein HDU76_006520, partial [Blyttiomyces sp. JEL0837]